MEEVKGCERNWLRGEKKNGKGNRKGKRVIGIEAWRKEKKGGMSRKQKRR